jgi:hypothetical protein
MSNDPIMTLRWRPAPPRRVRRVAGLARDGSRLHPRRASRRERLIQSFSNFFRWPGWKAVGAIAATLVSISTAVIASAAFVVSERTLQANTRQQTSDRFGKAIEELGSDKLDIRLGAMYGLEQLARDSPSLHPAVYDVLEAFVRVHAAARTGMCASPSRSPTDRLPYPPADILTVIDIIARRQREYDSKNHVVDFTYSCLRVVDFVYKQFPRTNLVDADLRNADFAHTQLFGSDLVGANLDDAYAENADFKYTKLGDTTLVGADLRNADFTFARMNTDHLSADFTGADLRGAILTDTDLSQTVLADILYDRDTRWPEGFQPPPSRPLP